MAILCDPLSKKFREFLSDQGAQGVNSYEWLDEPLYRGDPIAGRLTSWERAAVDKMHVWIKANTIDPLDKFERKLSEGIQTKEYATAPNGAFYRLDTKDGMIGCWRYYPWSKKATFLVGFSGSRFESVEDAGRWAVCDGRHEIAADGTELSKRKLIA